MESQQELLQSTGRSGDAEMGGLGHAPAVGGICTPL